MDLPAHSQRSSVSHEIYRSACRGADVCTSLHAHLKRGAQVVHMETDRLVAALMAESEQRGCYKTILDCSNDNMPFYVKSGMELKGMQMVCLISFGRHVNILACLH